MTDTIGVVGLGRMGGAMSTHLLAAGLQVVGYDVADAPRVALTRQGGELAGCPREVAERAGKVITSLPSAAALDAVLTGPDGLLAAARRPVIVVETSTLGVDDRWRAHDVAADAGVVLLDCPVSGTARQALVRDVVVFASGDPDAVEACRPVFDAIAREHVVLGPFGTGSMMKYLANHLVAVHTAAAAEAIVLGIRAGLDPQVVVDTLAAGAGNSRMLEVRGPLVAADTHEPVHMPADLFTKDLDVIASFAASVGGRTPVFDACAALHRAVVSAGMGDLDIAAVRRILDGSTGDPDGRV